ncbi:hypothetical protein [Providencia huaxiensis]|uniref:hypothetical protein n=1 Tax=Providencia huaxiensis TaxID=2027290 RepID=UPI0034E50221
MSDKEFKEVMYKKPHEMAQCGDPVPATGNLRDQFAMNSIPMTWRLVEAGCLDPDVNDMAKFAYQMADAMLAARGK